MKFIITILIILSLPIMANATEQKIKTYIENTVASKDRNIINKTRDKYRHPIDTLVFFGIKPNSKVVEILPGKGWYTEVLLPLLNNNGKLTVASFGADNKNEYLRKTHLNYVNKLNTDLKKYDNINIIKFNANGKYLEEIANNSQDHVLTFRNTHNWIKHGVVKEIYNSFYRVLKKGGILGVVQHRATQEALVNEAAKKGYVPEAYLIELLEDIGFELVEKSEINANPKDNKNYPNGVWSLPPTLKGGKTDQDKYLKIGESDRMTLRFIKP